MAYRWGGYFLVQGVDQPSEGDDASKVLWSVSDCVSYLYPGPWTSAQALEDDEAAELRSVLGLDVDEWAAVLSSVDGLERAGAMLWPHVFVDPDAARRFAASHLRNLADLRLLSIALPEDLVDGFVAAAAEGEGEGYAVIELLRRNQPVDRGAGTQLGFEVLGWDLGGFHSHLCNDLAPVFSDRLGIECNGLGLIDDEGAARRAAELANDPETEAESCPWLPWRVADHGLGLGACRE